MVSLVAPAYTRQPYTSRTNQVYLDVAERHAIHPFDVVISKHLHMTRPCVHEPPLAARKDAHHSKLVVTLLEARTVRVPRTAGTVVHRHFRFRAAAPRLQARAGCTERFAQTVLDLDGTRRTASPVRSASTQRQLSLLFESTCVQSTQHYDTHLGNDPTTLRRRAYVLLLLTLLLLLCDVGSLNSLSQSRQQQAQPLWVVKLRVGFGSKVKVREDLASTFTSHCHVRSVPHCMYC